MKKITAFCFCLAVYMPLTLFAQQAIPAAEGIFITLGKEIPNQVTYTISRRTDAATAWEELKTLHFEQDSAVFYAALNRAGAHYKIFEMPENRLRSNIWKMISAATTLDSVSFYGYTPAYREALQTAYYDETALPYVEYEYKITTQLRDRQEPLNETVIKGRYPAVVKKDFQMKALRMEPFKNKMVLKYISDDLQKPAGIVILRSTYMQTGFKPITGLSGAVNQRDSILYIAVDSLIETGKVYQYVAIPFDELGNEGLASDTIRIANIAYNNAPTILSVKTTSLEKESAIKLSWKLDNTPNMQSVKIYRSEDYDSKNYKLIGVASPTDSVFLDKKVHPVKNYYYTLIPVTQYGNGHPSARVIGMLKANKIAMRPQSLKAAIVNDKIRLSWKRPEFYTRGYYVYRSKGGLDTLKQVTDLIITDSVDVVYDDLPPASENGIVYTYAVKAVNTSYNISPLSEQINITTPLKVKLTTPINVKVRSVENRVMVFWDNHSDKNHLGFIVLRRTKDISKNNQFEKINNTEINAFTNFFEDKTAVKEQNYEYAIQAVAINGQLSAVSTPASLNIAQQILLPAYNLTAYADKNTVIINWDKTEQEDATEYKIYRLNGDKKELLGTVDKSISFFEDKKANTKDLNTYAVACAAKTVESELSTTVSVRTK